MHPVIAKKNRKRSAIPLCDKKIKTDQYEKKKDNMPLTSKESSRE
jgi:hypothetical protein